MSRFYVSPEDVKKDKLYIKGKESRHIVNVMRLLKGDRIVAFDGSGKEYHGSIERASRSEVVVSIEGVKVPESESPLTITLAQAVPKGPRMDYIVQKCTELGASRIIPIQTARTIVRLKEQRPRLRRIRWQRLAREASKQCGRSEVTEIGELKKLEDVVGEIGAYDLALIPCLGVDARGISEVLADYKQRKGGRARHETVIIFVGPEGDFTPQEIEEAHKFGAVPVKLGANVLRCDTAAIAAVAIVSYELGRP